MTIETIARYNIVLEGLLVRHRHVVDEVAMAVLGYKDGIMVDGKVKDLDAAESKIHYFLDRFFTNILSATLLINQHRKFACHYCQMCLLRGYATLI